MYLIYDNTFAITGKTHDKLLAIYLIGHCQICHHEIIFHN